MPRTILVTGTNRGLGLEFVRALSMRGDHVIATVRDITQAPAELRSLAKEVFPLEAADTASIAALAGELAGRPIDVLINNAGVMGDDAAPAKLSMETFTKVFGTNVFGLAMLTAALVPNLRAGTGKQVLNISSMLGSIAGPTPGFSYAYEMSKAALNMFTARLAKDLAREGFTVVSFCPGWNKTDMGGPKAPLDPAQSVAKLLATASAFTAKDSGSFRRIDGAVIPW